MRIGTKINCFHFGNSSNRREQEGLSENRNYRLEAILAVGYRVNSIQATDFRK
ncbi:virulence RhuM family protein [Belliella baltica]|uniref:virulence RhuM family protein n=1 Tax=Belliella baltica TaxID=232259 RepID=UPI0002EB7DCD|nr:virulence RhuM family protein [Belliella baltica]